ncbi:hypothetical protein [Bacillus massiliigorillae]|uniref:hypothetical protein n=1 Tax=Bacillus massiliigorillae TaxID=1243664 RepID=UPI0003A57112|nr:hypothetical protein [Bacillus massiliigorillae]
MRKILQIISIMLIAFIVLSGCMYPQSKRTENKIPYEDQVQLVQQAVDQYRKDQNGLLPIKTNEATVPIYQKYPIDFTKLVGKYMSDPPGNAYESGGVFQYVLIDVETNPTVKIFDLRMVDSIQEYGLRLQMFKDKNKYPPYKDQLDTYVFTLDYKKLGFNQLPVVNSPYSQAELGIIMNSKSELYIDYTPDLMNALKESDRKFKPGDDIRVLLTENSIFAPAFSLPYTVNENDEPVFMTK